MTTERSYNNLFVLEFPSSAEDAAAFDYTTSIQATRAVHGDTFGMQYGDVGGVVLCDPVDIEAILTTNSARVIKGPIYEPASRVLGKKATIFLDSPDWAESNARIRDTFKRVRVAAMVDTIATTANTYVEDLRVCSVGGAEVDLKSEMELLSFSTLSAVLLGEHADAALDELRPEELRYILRNTFDVARSARGELTAETEAEVERTHARLGRLVLKMVDHARHTEQDNTLLSILAHTAINEKTKELLADEIICDEIVGLAFGGYETTSLLMSWTFSILQNYPDIAARVRQEIQTILGDDLPTADNLRRLEYTPRVLKEVLRFRPPTPVIARLTTEKIVTPNGIAIDPWKAILLSIWSSHFHEKYWNNPQAFDPDRFLPQNSHKKQPTAFLGFSRGPRFCTGMNLALTEATIFTALLLRNFNIETSGDMTPNMNLVLDVTRTDARITPRSAAA